jgi:hypothetical protein
VADVAVGGHLHEFTAGPPGLGDDVAAALGVEAFDDELSYQDGTLLLSRTRPYDPHSRLVEDRLLAVWRGRGYSLVTQMYGAGPADVLGLLRTVRLAEHDDGIALDPDQKAGGYFVRPATVLKEVPGLGLLEMSRLTAQHAKSLPSWRGVSTPAGELFRDKLSDGNPYFVLAGDDTWATVVPTGTADPSAVSTLVGQLRLSTAR